MASVMSDSRTVYHDEAVPADQVVLHVADPEPSWPTVRVDLDEDADRSGTLVALGSRPDRQTRMFGLFNLGQNEPIVVGIEAGELAVTLARKPSRAGWEVRVHPSGEIARAYFSQPETPLVLRYVPQAG